jgi:hypothetical protein
VLCTRGDDRGISHSDDAVCYSKEGSSSIAIAIAHDLWLTPDSDEDLHREPPTLRLHDSTTQLQPAIGESGAIGQRSLLVELAKLNQGRGTSEEGGSLLY